MDDIARMIVSAYPALTARLPAAVQPYNEAHIVGVTTHWVPPHVVYSADLGSAPSGLVMAVIQAGRSKETLFVLMREGDRTLHFRCVGLNPWGAEGADQSSDRLAAALSRWDAGERSVRVSDEDDDDIG
jgi:hypothetical protein